MDKVREAERLAALSVLVYQEVRKDGVIALQEHLDRRYIFRLEAGVYLQPWKFYELFGDTEYEYREYDGANLELVKDLNGVVFYAIINKDDMVSEVRCE